MLLYLNNKRRRTSSRTGYSPPLSLRSYPPTPSDCKRRALCSGLVSCIKIRPLPVLDQQRTRSEITFLHRISTNHTANLDRVVPREHGVLTDDAYVLRGQIESLCPVLSKRRLTLHIPQLPTSPLEASRRSGSGFPTTWSGFHHFGSLHRTGPADFRSQQWSCERSWSRPGGWLAADLLTEREADRPLPFRLCKMLEKRWYR